MWICWATVSMWATLVTWINDGKFGHFEVAGHVDHRLCVCGSECKRHRAPRDFFFLSITKYSLCVSKLLSRRQCQFFDPNSSLYILCKKFSSCVFQATLSIFLPKFLPRDKTKLDLYLFSKSMETNSK